ncbi:MAG: NAD(P)-binding protein [Zoogloeaceae bacterium]|jgi:NADPH-dependent glutamate synthase beta subunit-like oxidoreductase|nr:NAD(P)-binding protein [Zoogloeaceae bacterium]
MSAVEEKKSVLNFRRYQDGDSRPLPWNKQIFQASHSYKCPTYIQSAPPCQASCPSGEDIRGYLNIMRGMEKPPLGADGKPAMPTAEYAWRRLTEANPFPAVMGRVCPAPCESGCNRNALEDHVGINAVEHFLGEYAIKNGLKFAPPAARSGKKIAVIGGGPAGLSCAYQLARMGHEATIFDEHEQLGGMMRYGIPDFRVPRDVLDAEIQRILDLGVKTRLKTRIGVDITLEDIRRQFDAVFLGPGAQGGRALPCADGEAPNVVPATAFLRAFNEGRLQHVSRRVVVVGGGDTSIDVATVARRLGAVDGAAARPEDVINGRATDGNKDAPRQGVEVVLTSVFPVDKMQANKHEIAQATAEGIDIRGGWAPVGVVRGADGRATALRVAQCKARFVGPKLEIEMVAGTEEDIPADLIVSAIGQTVDFSGLAGLDSGKGNIAADKNYQVAGQPGVFAGGDVIRPHLLTTAIGHGWVAADGIDRFLRGEEQPKRPKIDVHHWDMEYKLSESGKPVPPLTQPTRGTDALSSAVHNYDDRSERHVITYKELFLGHFSYTPRNARAVSTLTKTSALGNFAERLTPLDEKQVVAEAKRCMSCGLCFECDNCVVYCPQTAVKRVPKKDATTGRYVYTDYTRCIGCHICHEVCPTGYIQMGLGE